MIHNGFAKSRIRTEYVFGASVAKAFNDDHVKPSILYSYEPEPPVGEVIVIVPSLAPKQVVFIELTVAFKTAGCDIVMF